MWDVGLWSSLGTLFCVLVYFIAVAIQSPRLEVRTSGTYKKGLYFWTDQENLLFVVSTKSKHRLSIERVSIYCQEQDLNRMALS